MTPPPIDPRLAFGLETTPGTMASPYEGDFPTTWDQAHHYVTWGLTEIGGLPRMVAHGVLEARKGLGDDIPTAILYTLTFLLEGKEKADEEWTQSQKEKENR
jgi:hypothetical protein